MSKPTITKTKPKKKESAETGLSFVAAFFKKEGWTIVATSDGAVFKDSFLAPCIVLKQKGTKKLRAKLEKRIADYTELVASSKSVTGMSALVFSDESIRLEAADTSKKGLFESWQKIPTPEKKALLKAMLKEFDTFADFLAYSK